MKTKKQFVVFALRHKVTGNSWVDLAYDIKYKIRKLRQLVNDRTRADKFSTLFWSEVYTFDDLLVVILFRSEDKKEAETFLKSYIRAEKPAYNLNNFFKLRFKR